MKKILLSVFVFSILLPTLAFASFDTSLKYGSKSSAVNDLQDFLVSQGFLKGKVDGSFGLVTLNAVKAFQSANGLSSDGYFGKASRTKANDILATILAPSNTAEQTETGTISVNTSNQPVLDSRGCSATSLFSSTTGQPCSSTTQPATPNLPAGCTSTFGYSITTGQACNGLVATVQQLQQTIQQIAQNTTPVLTPTPTPIPTPTTTPTVDIKANGAEGSITVAYGAKPVITWTTKGMSGCSIKNSNGGIMTGNLDNTSGTAPWTDGTTTVLCNIIQLANGDMVNKSASDSVTINVDQSTIPLPTPIACVPNWQCGNWNMCLSSQQTRTCTDTNNCGVATNKPTLTQSCLSPSSVPVVSINQTTPASGLILPLQGQIGGSEDTVVGQFTVSAPSLVNIKMAEVKFNCSGSGFSSNGYGGQTFGLQDEAPLFNGSTEVSTSFCANGHCQLNTVIPAGQSQTFNLKAGVLGSADPSATASVSCNLDPAGFIWTDGNDHSGYISFTGLFIPNFPTSSYTIHQ